MAVTRKEPKLRPLILRKKESGTYLAGDGKFPVRHDFSVKTMFLDPGLYRFSRESDDKGRIVVTLANAIGEYEVDVPENMNDLFSGTLVSEEYD